MLKATLKVIEKDWNLHDITEAVFNRLLFFLAGTIPTLDAASNITTYHNEEVKQQQPVAMAATSRRSISMESIPNIALQNASHAHPIAESTQSINFNKYGTIGGYSVMKNNAARDDYVNVEPRDLNAQGSQRFRSINRSFRTAVDKSFDMPNLSGKFRLYYHL